MKIKIALIIGYNGRGYHGLQYNKTNTTIESVIVESLKSIKAIAEINAKDPHKIGLQRASRTDKGVHAAMAIVVCLIEGDMLRGLRSDLLSKNIYLYKIVRVPKGFLAKNRCDSRAYEYILPTSALSDPNESHRMSEGEFSILESIFKKHVTVQNFHNFTTASNSKGKVRNIKDIVVSKPFIRDGLEYVKVAIHGQSFMLHQIRKMVGFAILVMKYSSERRDELFDLCFSDRCINVPKVPSEYFLLDIPNFGSYNERHKSTHQPIVVDEEERIKVKEEIIYPEIFKKENLSAFQIWQKTIDQHSCEFEYLKSPNGLSSQRDPIGDPL